MQATIGKNTLGGGKKMVTKLNNYNRSTHDLSFVCRTTAAPGVLQPTMKQKVLPGDTFDIDIRSHILTHPTIGPLFGSFKVQNDFFFCPDRLYQAMLHNNALGVGLNMKTVKYPIIPIEHSSWDLSEKLKGSNGTLKNQVHPSSLPSYLGYKTLDLKEASIPNYYIIPAIPIIGYFDIFKNYYANKQEKHFYTISGIKNLIYDNDATTDYSITYVKVEKVEGLYQLNGTLQNITSEVPVDLGTNNSLCIQINSLTDINLNAIHLSFGVEINPKGNGDPLQYDRSIQELINDNILELIEIPESNSNSINLIFKETIPTEEINRFTVKFTVKLSGYTVSLSYNQYNLEEIDEMRENILASGRVQYSAGEVKFIKDIFKTITQPNGTGAPNCIYPMVGLALKTYQSDINVNWVNTEWIDGDTGINAITAIDTSGGSFTLDTLNLAKKVYTMLNRIAVSDGSYDAWIQTVYTSGGLNHIETPVYLGGSSSEIEFQEVISNSATNEQPLGSLAGRGVNGTFKGGKIKFKADEPGYIYCITSITPRVDYFQGNDWDLDLETLDDLHKPQLDGIGFQDRLYKNVNASVNKEQLHKSIGKQPAWIDYMTNYNKTFGNFALVENEGWMCLNRIFEDINTYTTYVQPHLYNNIFADTDLTAQNFWVQIAFNIKARRVMSAKVIPTL